VTVENRGFRSRPLRRLGVFRSRRDPTIQTSTWSHDPDLGVVPRFKSRHGPTIRISAWSHASDRDAPRILEGETGVCPGNSQFRSRCAPGITVPTPRNCAGECGPSRMPRYWIAGHKSGDPGPGTRIVKGNSDVQSSGSLTRVVTMEGCDDGMWLQRQPRAGKQKAREIYGSVN
jgi:hypothetical protein